MKKKTSSTSTPIKKDAPAAAKPSGGSKPAEPSEQELVRLQTTDPYVWRVEDVAKWLDYIQLGEYKTIFIENSISGDELLDLNAHELQSMGVKKVGHRKKLMRKIQSLQHHSNNAFNDGDGNSSEAGSDTSSSSERSWTSGRSGEPSSKKPQKLNVKCKFKGEWNVLSIKRDATLKKFKKKVRQEYHQRMKVSYKDSDGDYITIKKEKQWEDLKEDAVGKTIRLTLTPFKSRNEQSKSALDSKELQVLQGLLDPVCVINKQGIIQYFNTASENLFGYTSKEAIGSNVTLLMPQTTAESHDFYLWRYQKDRVARIIGKGRRVIAQKKDGQTFAVHLSITEGPNTFTGVFSEFHTSKGTEQDFSLLENLLQSVVVINNSGSVLFFNKQAEKLTGYSAMEVMGRNVSMLMPDPYRSEHDSYLSNYAKTGTAKIIGSGRDVVLKDKSGRVIPVHLSVTEQGELGKQLFTGILTPLQEKKEASKAMLDQQREVLEMLMVPAVVIDQNGIIQIFNKSASQLLGFSPTELIGKNVNILVPSPDKEKHDRYIKRYLKTGKSRVLGTGRDLVAQHKDGTMIPIHLSVTEKRTEDNSVFFSGVMQKI